LTTVVTLIGYMQLAQLPHGALPLHLDQQFKLQTLN
jgi:hypothetical protein